jgi:hypothetical protein
MGCGASSPSSLSPPPGLLAPFRQREASARCAVDELAEHSRRAEAALRVEIAQLRQHSEHERGVLGERVDAAVHEHAERQASASEALLAELGTVAVSLEEQLRRLKWEASSSSAHVSHLGARLTKVRDQRAADQAQTAQLLQLIREGFQQEVRVCACARSCVGCGCGCGCI